MSQSPRQCSILSLGVRGLSSCTISVLLLCTEKVPSEKKVKSLSHVRLCDLMDCSPPGSSVHGIFQARVLEWGAISFSRGSPQPRDRTWVSQIADILPSEPPGKPKKVQSGSRSVVSDSLRPHGLYSAWNSPGQNTGVGSLSLLQGIIPTQGSNPGLPHGRRILYQLSHKGSSVGKGQS